MAITRGAPKIVTDGLVLHLDAANHRSYPKSGTTWTDLSGNGNNGTLTNGPTFSGDNVGSIVFDSTNDYVRVPFNSSIALSSSGSLSVWCYPATLTQRSFAGLMGMTTGGSGGQQSYYIHWRQFNNTIAATIQNSGTYNIIAKSPPQVIAWYNFVFTWNGSSLNLYENGESAASPVSQTINAQQLNTQVDIGGNMFGAAAGISGFFNGRISNAKIYNRALSATEIQQNFNATRARYGV